MVLKLPDLFSMCVDITCRRHKNFLLQSCQFLHKRQFCSKRDQDDSPQEEKVKELLEASSPLRISNADSFWATSPYPAGTTFEDLKIDEESETSKEPRRRVINAKLGIKPTSSVVLFPGQGNQFVGMAKNILKYPTASKMFAAANEILGYDLLKICLNGPESVLNDTKHCQPATFVCSLALLEKLKEEKPWAISNCVATCGYSLGELTALVFAGCVNFETGLKLVRKRSEAMAECCESVPGGMLTIITGHTAKLHEAFSDAIAHCRSNGIENPECTIASYLFPNCKVVAGNTEALDFLVKNAKKYSIRKCSRLPVSGAFHTSLMKDAAEPFRKALIGIELKDPIVKLFSNVTGRPYNNRFDIQKTLPKQIYRPVKWEQTMQYLLSAPKELPLPHLYECGPGDSLSAIAKKNNSLVEKLCCAIQL